MAQETYPSIDEVREQFARDRFATLRLGAEVVEASLGHAVCSCELTPEHRNAMDNVMGGAVFSLADFASAVASNAGQQPAVTVSSSIEFVGAAKGERLIATCDVDKAGRRLCHYTTRVTDELGTLIAVVISSCMRV